MVDGAACCASGAVPVLDLFLVSGSAGEERGWAVEPRRFEQSAGFVALLGAFGLRQSGSSPYSPAGLAW